VNTSPVIEIRTPRLCCRPVVGSDLEVLEALFTDPDVRRYLWDNRVASREETEAVIDKSAGLFDESGSGLWLLFRGADRAAIGFCGFMLFREPPELELIYGLLPAHWGKGLATEAARAMIRYGFEQLGFARIKASADGPNTKSFGVMERAGMTFERRTGAPGAETLFYTLDRAAFDCTAVPCEFVRG